VLSEAGEAAASCLFVVEQLGCWRRIGSSNLKQSLLYVSSLLNSLAAGDDLSFKSETVFENEEVRLTMPIANAQQTLC